MFVIANMREFRSGHSHSPSRLVWVHAGCVSSRLILVLSVYIDLAGTFVRGSTGEWFRSSILVPNISAVVPNDGSSHSDMGEDTL